MPDEGILKPDGLRVLQRRVESACPRGREPSVGIIRAKGAATQARVKRVAPKHHRFSSTRCQPVTV